MNYFGIALTILSHIVAGIYLEKPKYNKVITTGIWLAFALCSVCLVLLQQNTQYVFYNMLLAQLITFFIATKGPAGEKTFLFLTYANTFCISIGARLYLMAFLGECAYLPILEIAMIMLMHILLCKFLLPTYKKAKIFFASGWLRINLILVFFLIQFINQYAFTIADRQSAQNTILDFVMFSIIFYSTLFFIFSAVKDAAEINKKTFENNELKNKAYVDELTRMKNRTAYMKFAKKQTLEHRINKSGNFISVVMDIDGFKNINDIKGHNEGDKILRKTGTFMLKYFEPVNCKLFRVGGDEFVLILKGMESSEITTQMETMNARLFEKVGVTMSYGWSEIDFDTAKPFEEAFKKADKMMYDNKQKKKSNA